MHLCRFCDKECKNENSLRNHERLCNSNPNRQYTKFADLDFQKNKNNNKSNQYIKAKKLGLEKPQTTEKQKEALRLLCESRDDSWHKSNGRKISKTINQKVEEGTWHTSLAKHMHIDYNGNDLHGTWELRYAEYLDANRIRRERNKKSFSYVFDGKNRKYTPDFYIISNDTFVEIKSYKTAKDEAKWAQFPSDKTLIVLMKEQLINLGIDVT